MSKRKRSKRFCESKRREGRDGKAKPSLEGPKQPAPKRAGPIAQQPDLHQDGLPPHQAENAQRADNMEHGENVEHAQNPEEMDRNHGEDREALWNDCATADLTLASRGFYWSVHQRIIAVEAPRFYQLITTMANGGRIVDLSAWQPQVLGELLRFLYVHDYVVVDGYPPEPSNLRCVPFHVHMVCQGWTLNFPRDTLRDLIVEKINQSAREFKAALDDRLGQCRLILPGYLPISDSLYEAIFFLYSQTEINLIRKMLPVRAALCRLVDIALPWLLEQPGFSGVFNSRWVRGPVGFAWQRDHYIFGRIGCLFPSWREPTMAGFEQAVNDVEQGPQLGWGTHGKRVH